MRIFLARDPGGANVIAPLFRACPGPKLLWAKDYARAIMARDGLPFRDFNAEVVDRPVGAGDMALVDAWLASQLSKDGATLLITATGHWDDFTERLAWEAAAARSLPSLAVIDSWVRPLERFVVDGHTYRPGYVVTPAPEAAARLRAAGCARGGVEVLPHPYLQDLLEKIPSLEKTRETARKSLARRFAGATGDPQGTLAAGDSPIALFVSEPFSALKGAGSAFADIAFDEFSAFALVKEAWNRSGLAERGLLVIKQHPKEAAGAYAGRHDCVIKDELSNFELIAAADFVVGIKGMMLVESVLFGKRTAGLVLTASPDEQLITNRLGLSDAVSTASQLEDFFREGASRPAPRRDVIAGALRLGPLDGYFTLMEKIEA